MSTSPQFGSATNFDSRPGRIASVDLIRGAVMILMAIDHVRVYAGIHAGGTNPGVFFTRWITHFCAPAFLLLAGTSAFLYARKHPDLTRFLLTRGAWLIFLELTVLRIAWTFNIDFAQYDMAGVIWVIGWSMIVLAGLSKLPTVAVGTIGVAIIAGHNLLDPVMGSLVPSLGNDLASTLWKIAYVGFFAGPIHFGENGPDLFVLYSLIPWVGVMAAGFAFGGVLTMEEKRRNQLCKGIGFSAMALFLVLRGFDLYGDPRPWSAVASSPNGPPWVFAFLNTTKYPASLLFLLMTLGPTIMLIPALEKAKGSIARWVSLFGQVPFFFYLLHIPLIHVLAIGVSLVRLGEVSPWLFMNHPMSVPEAPDGYTWGLGVLYVVWAIAIVILYYACRWYAELKAKKKAWWMAYV